MSLLHLVLFIINSSLDHFNRPLSPPHHFPTQRPFPGQQRTFKAVCPHRPLLCWKPPMIFCNGIKWKLTPWFRKPYSAGPCLPLQAISFYLLSVHGAPITQISILFCEHTWLFSLRGALPWLFLLQGTFLPPDWHLINNVPFTYPYLQNFPSFLFIVLITLILSS